MFLNFLQNVKIVRALNNVGAGTGTSTSSTIDMSGFDSVCVVAELGAVVNGASVTLQIQDGADSNGADATNISGASASIPNAAGSSNNQLVVDVTRPQNRYITAEVVIASDNATIDCVTFYLYNAKDFPVTQPATVAGSTSLEANS